MLEGDRNSFERTVKITDIFGVKSGLFLNAGKTSAIWLGSRRNSPHFNMEWNPPEFKMLGIWFTNDMKQCEVINFPGIFLEIKALYNVC